MASVPDTLPKLRLSYEWEPGEDVRSPELAATWASLELSVGSECITRVEDLQSGSARRSIYCALYPLAEWAAFNWWYLVADLRPASLEPHLVPRHGSRNGGAPVRTLRHHMVRGAGDGFAFPNLIILPQGATTRLIWYADGETPASAPLRYVSAGHALVDARDTELVLADLIESVLTRLREAGVGGSALEAEWEAISAADDEERAFCTAAARLGLDPYQLPDRTSKLIAQAADFFDETTLHDFLGSVNPRGIDRSLDWVERGYRRIERWRGKASPELETLREGVARKRARGNARPWLAGYDQARHVRRLLGLKASAKADLDDLVSSMRSQPVDPGLQGIGGISSHGSAALVLSDSMKARAARFAEARALWHFIFEPRRSRFLLTIAHAEPQRVERAFAAELLAPAKGLRDELGRDASVVTDAEADRLADHFGVSPLVIGHQIENQLDVHVV